MDLKTFIRDIEDFPRQGVVFKDITPLLANAKAIRYTLDRLVEMVGVHGVDKVVGMESRGFFFGPLLAQRLNAGFVPVRKPNKLPSEKISQTYDLEYGTDTLDMHSDAILAGEKVLVHDDVLATGGTAKATCNLVERLGGEIVQCNFLIELDFLKGRDKLGETPVKALLNY
ncbi:adenine phosphoribosyltransferase [Zobellia galactanivorans]|uniref:Adenine phosphoribosyltransferase n=1 Tax=Zobellia galactanivorans (strain DSM 12802 / CCUG 47099 / CIP 106680 / NCIMB 13871 / Dsij) TaxID=63186 RepID=G0LCH0_ZOBGA|nr:adenine phosphoribosyltransferase [Zobellia galactanivorans]MBU3025399.1 adenine phosphoribosyltransferase [Zobellia galactanivorans]CAZ96936.1 Adenine phosphoribosyltransferase [Zobellia galactanivorans]